MIRLCRFREKFHALLVPLAPQHRTSPAHSAPVRPLCVCCRPFLRAARVTRHGLLFWLTSTNRGKLRRWSLVAARFRSPEIEDANETATYLCTDQLA